MKIERQLAVWALLLLAGGVINAGAFAEVNANKADAFHPVVKQFSPDTHKHPQHHASAKGQKSHSAKIAKARPAHTSKIAVAHSSKTKKPAAVKAESIHAAVTAKSSSTTKIAKARAADKIMEQRKSIAQNSSKKIHGRTFTFTNNQKFASSLAISKDGNAARLAKPALTSREMHAALRSNYINVAVASEPNEVQKINLAIAGKKIDAVKQASSIKLASAAPAKTISQATVTNAASAAAAAKTSAPVIAAKIAGAAPAKNASSATAAPVVIPPTIVVAANLAREDGPASPENIANAQRVVPSPDGKDMVAIHDVPLANDSVKIVTGDLTKDEFYVFGANEPVPDEIITKPNTQIAVLGGTEEEAASKIAAFKIAMKKALETKMIAEKEAAVKVIVAVQSTEKAISNIKKTVRGKFLDSRPVPSTAVLDKAVSATGNELSVPATLDGAPMVKEASEQNTKAATGSKDAAAPAASSPVNSQETEHSLSASNNKAVLEDKIVVPEVKLVKIKKMNIAPAMELASLNKKTRA